MRMRAKIMKAQRGRPRFRIDTSFKPQDEQHARALVLRKHASTVARKHAFLDLNAAGARFSAYERYAAFVKAMGGEMNPERKQEDMQYWMDRYMATVRFQREVFHPSF
jgi:succinate dehydrogenase/fumarate reductase flavoprotein subunit